MEDYNSSIPMQRTTKIIRRSIFSFLQNYQFFTTTAAFFAFPFAASFLLLQSFIPSSSFFPIIYERLHLLFDAAGFPSSSEFFTLINSKISQTIAISFLAFPFTISSFLFSKASVIEALNYSKPAQTPSFFSSFFPLLLTQLCNSLVIISANATCFTVLFFGFNLVDYGFGLSSPRLILLCSATGAVICSIILANTLIVCNLALVISGTENIGGYMAILKSCILIRGRTATALSLAVPVSLALAAVEALFQYRIVRAYYQEKTDLFSLALEGIFIAYMYSILLVLDTIVSIVFYRSCKTDEGRILPYQVEIQDRDEHTVLKIKTLEEFF
ncbi:uncharacterized protein LOC107802827 [Nicotiana tabacum]|uniref:Uncharacterized protein LOC107802827 n=1 Tax=Nicotiana tabacum TaxID=4097 RepID=A0A1S4AZ02_TOBAC|nr:PREDICTED: uncharacterized protein LOC107802827 [Nicotiana tabacum]